MVDVKTIPAILKPLGKAASAKSLTVLRKIGQVAAKNAAIGGEQESGFEQSFATLGYSYLKDKAPRLLDHIVGFQLLDRNEDMTKAIGVFGFQVGSQWLYVPIFFLNGELRGHELLYVKNQDMFVPMKENWVNYLLSKRPHILGEPSAKDTFQLGGMWPDLRALNNSYRGGKYASESPDVQEWAKPFLPVMARIVTGNPLRLEKYAGMLTVPDLLRTDLRYATCMHETCERYPRLRKACEDFYGRDFLKQAVLDLKNRVAGGDGSSLLDTPAPKQASSRFLSFDDAVPFSEEHPFKSGASRIMRVDPNATLTVNISDDQTRDEASTRIRGNVTVVDKRKPSQRSVAYNTIQSSALTNPTESQIAKVLIRQGDFVRCLILKHPYGGNGQQPFVTLINLDGKEWLNSDSTNIWLREESLPETLRSWFDKLPSGRRSLSKGGVYVAVCADGSGTLPFRVKESKGGQIYAVEFLDSYEESSLPLYSRDYERRFRFRRDYPEYCSWDSAIHLNDRKGSSFKAISGELYIPESAKILRVDKPSEDEDDCCYGTYDKLELGSLADIQLQITQKTAHLKLHLVGDTLLVTRPAGTERLNRKDAFVSLITNHGLGEEQALEMIKLADAKGSYSFRVKYAEPFHKFAYGGYRAPGGELINQGPTAPAPGPPQYGSELPFYGGAQNIYPQEEFLEIPGMNAGMTDPQIYDPTRPLDPETINGVMDAANTGQKEVFDTSMLSTLLRAVNEDTIVDRYLGDLMKGCDRLGRILFSFYWHGETVKERYGAADVPEIMDAMRNAFESLGDVTLKLRQNSTNADAMELSEPSVEDVARVD